MPCSCLIAYVDMIKNYVMHYRRVRSSEVRQYLHSVRLKKNSGTQIIGVINISANQSRAETFKDVKWSKVLTAFSLESKERTKWQIYDEYRIQDWAKRITFTVISQTRTLDFATDKLHFHSTINSSCPCQVVTETATKSKRFFFQFNVCVHETVPITPSTCQVVKKLSKKQVQVGQ